MNKRLWLNLLLLVVGAVLVYFIGYQPSQPEVASKRLFSTSAYEANEIRIQRQTQTDISLRKKGQQWLLIEPGIAPVNEEKVKHLLTILQEPVIASYDPQGKDLAQYGLDPGKIKLTINAEEATFGSTNPVTLNRYILKNNSIYTIKEIVYGVLGSSVTPLLSHHLLPRHVEVTTASAPEMFAHSPATFWQSIEAINIADYSGDETIIGKIKLSISNNDLDRKQTIELDILGIKPSLTLGRSDLQVKYTFDNKVMSKLRELE